MGLHIIHKLQKMSSLPANHPQHFATLSASKGNLGNNSNILKKNDYTYLIFHLGTPFKNQVIVHIYRFHRNNNNNNTLAAILRTATRSLTCCMNAIPGNFGKYFSAAQ